MYESFYHLREKPFTLLPDPGFLYLSNKHRMALTLLEYGLMNQAGFTVISGDIGAGKTTLIHHLLNNMDREHTVGLISNTHRDFGELLQWILLAFNLAHKNMDKVEMYQRLVEFIIDEYAHNRRTVLIVDEAQNMAAETLEELRMLSNINADKDQPLQVILVGQRELRDTLRRPDLVQFAQRISVDYHLEPLSAEETVGYIRHRMEVAGGYPNTFTEAACLAVHRYSNGVPRLINLLCDTALVYGYAEQKQRIDARLVTDVAREKQQGGIFPTFAAAEFDETQAAESAAEEQKPAVPADAQPETRGTPAAPAASVAADIGAGQPHTQQPQPVEMAAAPHRDDHPRAAGPLAADQVMDAIPESARPHSAEPDADDHRTHSEVKKKTRLAVCSARENLRQYLSRLLESYGFDVVTAVPLDAESVARLDAGRIDVLLIDRAENAAPLAASLMELLAQWDVPVLYNDFQATETCLHAGNLDFGRELAEQINSLTGPSPQPAGVVS